MFTPIAASPPSRDCQLPFSPLDWIFSRCHKRGRRSPLVSAIFPKVAATSTRPHVPRPPPPRPRSLAPISCRPELLLLGLCVIPILRSLNRFSLRFGTSRKLFFSLLFFKPNTTRLSFALLHFPLTHPAVLLGTPSQPHPPSRPTLSPSTPTGPSSLSNRGTMKCRKQVSDASSCDHCRVMPRTRGVLCLTGVEMCAGAVGKGTAVK